MQVLSASEHTAIDAGAKHKAKTHCPKGHEYTAENTGIDGNGSRYCKQCAHDRGFERRRQIGETPGLGVGAHERAKTHCPKGHEYTAENTFIQKKGSRVCRTCKKEQQTAARRNRGVAERVPKTHCPYGHPYSGDNLIIKASGSRGCRACNIASARASHEKRRREALKE